jgi:hypothetical protein
MLKEDRAMMKAFMSTQRAHGSGYDSPRLQTGVEALLSDRAVNEASRILAQNEPKTWHLAGCLQTFEAPLKTINRNVRPGSLHANVIEAACESLAAFCALEIS